MDIKFMSLGMLTIDDIHFGQDEVTSNTRPPLLGIIGGAGTFAVMGARLFSLGLFSRSISWVVHMGHDFPASIRTELDSWNLATKYIDTPNRSTTRAKNTYAGELRSFEFLTPKIQVDESMLGDALLGAACFHIIGTPRRCVALVNGIQQRRQVLGISAEPVFVWEPMEHSCSPGNFEAFLHAMDLVHTFSPNEDELAKLLGIELSIDTHIEKDQLGSQCNMLLQKSRVSAIVVRLGGRGVYVAERERDLMLPALHGPDQVVDVTGGGNAFMGGYAMGLLGGSNSDGLSASQNGSVYGSVAASFAIEQIGMPILRRTGEAEELWNNASVLGRLETYRNRIKCLL